MKKILFIALLFVSATLWSQQLSTLYKSGELKLVPDAEYAKNNDWNKPVSDNKQIVVAPDGSVFISLHTGYSIS